MKTATLVLTCVLLLVSTAAAQAPDTVWTRVFDTNVEDYCMDVTFTSDECIVTTGIHYIDPVLPEYSSDIALRKVDADGNEVWYHHYDYDGQDQVYAIDETSDGDLVTFGLIGSGMDDGFSPFILKTDADGTELWHQSYPVEGYSVIGWWGIQTSDNGYLIAGSSVPDGAVASQTNGMLLKTDADGTLEWYKEYGGDYKDQLNSVIETSDGHFVAAGQYYILSDHTNQGWLLKVDAQGNEVWSSVFGASDDQTCASVCETASGSFVACGYTGDFGGQIADGFVAEIGANGDSLGFAVLDPLDDEVTFLRAIMPVYDQESLASITGYCIYGYSLAAGDDYGTSDLLLIGLDLDAEMDWFFEFGTDEEEWGYRGITQAWDNGCVVVASVVYATTDGQACYVARLDGPNITGVHEIPVAQPSSFTLAQPYPNPFNPSTSVTVTLPEAGYLTLAVYDALGRHVSTVAEGQFTAGNHLFTLNGSGMANGVYFIRASVPGGMNQVRKVVLMK